MKEKKIILFLSSLLILTIFSGCAFDPTRFYPKPKNSLKSEQKHEFVFVPISGLDVKNNQKIRELIKSTDNSQNRRVAVFSIDGVLINKVPYSAADEAMLEYAKNNPNWKPELLKKILNEDKNSTEYIKDRALFWAGLNVATVEQFGNDVLRKHYSFYPGVYDIVNNLSANGFEIWLVTSAPEALYQKFFSEYLNIPKSRVIGTKLIVNDGKLTDKLLEPYPTISGKVELVETFIKETPLLVAGGSFRDAEMIRLANRIKLAVNPNNKIKLKCLHNEYMDIYAMKHKWMIYDAKDVVNERTSNMAAESYKIKPNEPIDI